MAQQPSAVREIVSAGVVVFRPGKQVLLVHRPKYDDWSFPKGKLDRGEHAVAAAVREVEEETGLGVRLGRPLGDQRYPVKQGMKTVHYWTGRARGDDDVSGYTPNAEIDEVAWVDLAQAPARLTYPYDVATLREARAARRRTRTVVVLRHAGACSRKAWRQDDRDRPLLQAGRAQAERLAPLLAAYDVRRLVTSSSLRCVETLLPCARVLGVELEPEPVLSEEDASAKRVRRLVTRLVRDLSEAPASAGGVVVCTHRPVLPWVADALGIEEVRLEPGEMVVVHQRKGTTVATERHRIP